MSMKFKYLPLDSEIDNLFICKEATKIQFHKTTTTSISFKHLQSMVTAWNIAFFTLQNDLGRYRLEKIRRALTYIPGSLYMCV